MKFLSSMMLALFFSMSSIAVAHQNAHDPEARLKQAINGEHRSAENKARDQYRHPLETLLFFGFKPEMTIVEMVPGGGWYTEILAPALQHTGTYIGATYPNTGKDDYYSRTRQAIEAKLKSNEVYSEAKLVDFVPRQPSQLAEPATVDMVLTFRNLHNWGEDGMLQVFKDAYVALKPGGVLGIVEHRMPATMDWESNKRSGYVPEAMVIDLAQQAGFNLAAKSEINANEKDTADHPKGVWTLPPVLRLKEQDKDKYLAIGESDRMTLKFIKPNNP
jgi:predicted methyltransferase